MGSPTVSKIPWIDNVAAPVFEVDRESASLEMPLEVFEDSDPIWRSFIVGYFIGDASHVGTIHATVNRIWTPLNFKAKIDVQFIDKDMMVFHIENEALWTRITKHHYWNISDILLVVNEWSLETAATPPNLSAMPFWMDFKFVPGHLFSKVGLKAVSTHVGSFVKLHPQTERCTRLDAARLLLEVNLHKPLVESVQFEDQNGVLVKVVVSYPWLPSRCSICSRRGHTEW
ncbi:hypothetical protein N665_0453s0004 [Sinapis alba]|nr:hypothetical protein N665_0453s0004 [Sinapis alba]